MAALPEEFQVEFWKKNFPPLLGKEDVLRQKVAEVLKSRLITPRTLTPKYTEPARKGEVVGGSATHLLRQIS